jgi:biotin transport system permease protein
VIDGIYVQGNTPLHRMRAGAKLAALFALGTAVFLIDDLMVIGALFLAVTALLAWLGMPRAALAAHVKFLVPLFAIILVAHGLLTDWTTGVLVVLRFAALIGVATLVTMTTRTAEMLNAIEFALSPLGRLGVDVAKVSLGLSLALRFIPVVARIAAEVREAQRARGLERSVVALVLPVIVRLLRMADDIADAIDARS